MRNKLFISCPHFSPLHGLNHNSSKNIDKYDLIQEIIEPESFSSNIEEITKNVEGLNMLISEFHEGNVYSPNATNMLYRINQLIQNGEFFKINIGDVITLPGDEMVAIHKTYALSILQRKWRKHHSRNNDIDESN